MAPPPDLGATGRPRKSRRPWRVRAVARRRSGSRDDVTRAVVDDHLLRDLLGDETSADLRRVLRKHEPAASSRSGRPRSPMHIESQLSERRQWPLRNFWRRRSACGRGMTGRASDRQSRPSARDIGSSVADLRRECSPAASRPGPLPRVVSKELDHRIRRQGCILEWNPVPSGDATRFEVFH